MHFMVGARGRIKNDLIGQTCDTPALSTILTETHLVKTETKVKNK